MSSLDLGFLGGGQLARMSIMAAQRMGFTCLSLDPTPNSPAAQVAEGVVGALADPLAIAEVFRRCDRVTLENEFIPGSAIREAILRAGADESRLMPGVACLETIQDKLRQREAYARSGVPSPHALALRDADQALDRIGLPMVLKARFGGYDGKGTRTVRTREELAALQGEWGEGGWLAETFVPFRRELAVMVFRSPLRTGAFSTMETVQTDHVCDLVFPAGVDASAVAIAAAEAVGGFGLFGVELFEAQDGSFLVNEIAPRPHNTGHYSLDGGGVSQFEQHVRLAMGLPLAEPTGRPVCMANLLGRAGAGDFRHGLAAALTVPGVHLHWYGKENRAGRKMGHLNAVGEGCVERAVEARHRFYKAWAP
ncbi:MAG: ATP-grasp domain-containing protein [Fimbriimonadaceae bacterium]|nr:ATP-grasp domain-containing protein [Fimbriimonadaceae bacterium]